MDKKIKIIKSIQRAIYALTFLSGICMLWLVGKLARKYSIPAGESATVHLFVTAVVVVVMMILCCLISIAVTRRTHAVKQNRDRIIQALCSNYNAVFDVNFTEDTIKYLRMNSKIDKLLSDAFLVKQPIVNYTRIYADKVCLPEYRDEFLAEASQENIQNKLKDRDYFTYIYMGDKNGKPAYFQMKAVKMDDLQNHVIIGFADVDDEIRMEEGKRRITREAVEEAEKANRVKNIFLANMSHDLRTPLNAIMGFSSVAEWHLDDSEKMKKYIANTKQAANQMLYLVDNLLDMSDIENRAIELINNPFDIKQLLDEVESILQPEAKMRNQELKFELKNVKHIHLNADDLKIKRILINLCGNALKFTDAGGRITLTTSEMYHNEDEVRFEFRVKDNGIGMSEEYVMQAFDMFSREFSATDSGVPGSGVGLTITKRLVDSMDGTIAVESIKGEGTEFVVKLKLCREAGNQDDIEAANMEWEEENKAFVSNGHRILVVEDNELNRDIVRRYLRVLGYTVEEAENGKIGLDKFAASEAGYYDAILMDLQMPVMNGYDSTRAIRALNRSDSERIPIIAVTAYAFAKDAAESRHAGMNEHLAKPFKIDKLAAILDKYIEKEPTT